MDTMTPVGVLIPSYHPERELLIPFLGRLQEAGFGVLVVIDDGSGEEYRAIFDEAEALGATVLRHDVNRGKGRALKTGFTHCATLDGLVGVVTADSDGQHSPHDITAVARKLLEVDARTAVFGSRDFTGDHVPPKSRFGNQTTSRVLKLLTGQYLTDTQTGLRGFRTALAQESADVKGERFEYEMNVVLWLLGSHHPIVEVPIETIYHDLENSVSHFRPVRDSAMIYGVIIRQFGKFFASSVGSAALDLAVYAAIVDWVFGGTSDAPVVVAATIGARIVSSLANFAVNRRAVFEDSSNPGRAMARYYVLAAALMGASAAGTAALAALNGGHAVWAKVVADCLLFLVSYVVQKRWVFRDDSLLEDH